MQNSFRKYSEGPIVQQTSFQNIDKVTPPIVYACQDRQFNFKTAKSYGYSLIYSFLTGVLDGKEEISWKGKYGNKTFAELQKELFESDYSNASAVTIQWNGGHQTKVAQEYEMIFVPSYGNCMKLKQFRNGILVRSTKQTIVLLVDPSKRNDIRVIEMDNAKQEFGPSGFGQDSFSSSAYLMKISLHDKSINDGVTCTDYKHRGGSYGQCMEQALKDKFSEGYGCLPPWLPRATGEVCEQDKDVKVSDMKSITNIYPEILKLIEGLDLDMFNECLPPCHTMKVEMREMKHTSGYIEGFVKYSVEDEVTVFTDVYAYDIFDLVVDLGSAIGLWLGLCALSIFDSLMTLFLRFCKLDKS